MTDCTAFSPVDKIPNQTKAHNMYSSPHDSQEGPPQMLVTRAHTFRYNYVRVMRSHRT